jgi:hypothetical protein
MRHDAMRFDFLYLTAKRVSCYRQSGGQSAGADASSSAPSFNAFKGQAHTMQKVRVLYSYILTQLVKRAPPLNKENPTSSTWHHQRRAITSFFVEEIVNARR